MNLSALCGEVNNWFDRDQPKYHGTFTISDGMLTNASALGIQVGQYFRIIGSVFNDGAWKYTGQPDEGLRKTSSISLMKSVHGRRSIRMWR